MRVCARGKFITYSESTCKTRWYKIPTVSFTNVSNNFFKLMFIIMWRDYKSTQSTKSNTHLNSKTPLLLFNLYIRTWGNERRKKGHVNVVPVLLYSRKLLREETFANPPKNHFHGINFRKFYYSAILYRIIYNFANFIFANLKKL